MHTRFHLIGVLIVSVCVCLVARDAAGEEWQQSSAPIGLWNGVACSSNAARIVATRYSGQIYTSADFGATWTARESNRLWMAVASSADGEKLVAVVNGGGSRIYTSTNAGADWTPRGPTNLNWSSVASSADGTRLLAAVSIGQLYTSSDSGVTWTPREVSRNWVSVASSHDGARLVAAVGAGQIYTSVNFGTNWTPRESSRAWWGVASSANGSNLLASAFSVLDTLPGRLCVSVNAGLNWTSYQTNGNWGAVASSGDGGKLFAVLRPNGLYVSTNLGVTWTAMTITDRWSSVACSLDGNQVIAASENAVGTGGTGRIYLSPPLPPRLQIVRTFTNTVVVRWSSFYTNWDLQQTTVLPAGNWGTPSETLINDGTNRFIIADPPLGMRFFRLLRP